MTPPWRIRSTACSPKVVGSTATRRSIGCAADRDADAAVLRHAALGDVEAAHHLQAGERPPPACECRRLAQLPGHPVDADPDDEAVGLRHEVDVGRAMAERHG